MKSPTTISRKEPPVRTLRLLCLLLLLPSGALSANPAVHVITTPQSARLPAIPFRIAWLKRIDSGYNAPHLRHTFDGLGNIYWIMRADLAMNTPRPAETTVQAFPKRARAAQATRINFSTIETFLNGALGKTPDGYAQKVILVNELDSDREGNLYLEVALHYQKYPAWISWRIATGQPELIVSPAGAERAAKTLGLQPHLAGFKLRVNPHGVAWFLAWRRHDPSNDWARPRMSVHAMQRQANGTWNTVRVTPRFAPGAALPTQQQLAWGAPDWNNGWVFYTGESIWRMAPSGEARPLVHARLLGAETRAGDPVVTKNGDFWLAVSRSSAVSTQGTFDRQSGHFTQRLIFALSGDRSRLLRVRLLPGNKAAIGEIGSEALVAAWKQAGLAIKYGGHLGIAGLRPDYANDGITAYDEKEMCLFSLVPGD